MATRAKSVAWMLSRSLTNEELSSRICSLCGNKSTKLDGKTILGARPHWYHNSEGKLLCRKCWRREHDSPKRLNFTPTNERIQLKSKPRIGICSRCEKSVERGEIKRTNLHHIQYNLNSPLAFTIELCPSCHMKEHWKSSKTKLVNEKCEKCQRIFMTLPHRPSKYCSLKCRNDASYDKRRIK